MSPIRVDDDLLPTTVFAVPLTQLGQPAGWLVGEFSLEEMWRMVDDIRIGAHGFALVVAPDGTLVAHGDPDKKALVAQARNMKGHPLVDRRQRLAAGIAGIRRRQRPAPARRRRADSGSRLDGHRRAADQGSLRHRNSPAEAASDRHRVALLLMIGVGLRFGRRFIAPIFTLKGATEAVAAGDLESRVTITTGDEFTDLGNAFNSMADRLVELQENVKRQERQAMFGRIAAGLVHDLSHPIQNIGNSTRLLMRDDVDAESREMFQRTIERELMTLKRFMDDLRNVVKPKPVERFPLEINASVAEIVESMHVEAERSGVAIETHYAQDPLVIAGDRFALGRVYRNLITNAIQATAAGGRVSIATVRDGDHVVDQRHRHGLRDPGGSPVEGV